MTTQAFTAQTADNLGADKIARSATAYAFYNNTIWAGDKGLGTIDTTTTYNSGSGTWTKPAGFDDRDTVLIRMWGGGGSGAAINAGSSNASGGGGGGFSEFSYLYVDCPATLAYVVGAGGDAVGSSANGNAGGDSYITDAGVEIIRAKGGVGGTPAVTTTQTGGAGGTSRFLTQATTPTHWAGATGGTAGNGESTAGGYTAHGGGGGGAATLLGGGALTTGGASYVGGAGGAGSNNTATAGTAPGGGGGGAANTVPCTSGAGGAGRIEFIIMRGRHATYHSWFK